MAVFSMVMAHNLRFMVGQPQCCFRLPNSWWVARSGGIGVNIHKCVAHPNSTFDHPSIEQQAEMALQMLPSDWATLPPFWPRICWWVARSSGEAGQTLLSAWTAVRESRCSQQDHRAESSPWLAWGPWICDSQCTLRKANRLFSEKLGLFLINC